MPVIPPRRSERGYHTLQPVAAKSGSGLSTIPDFALMSFVKRIRRGLSGASLRC